MLFVLEIATQTNLIKMRSLKPVFFTLLLFGVFSLLITSCANSNIAAPHSTIVSEGFENPIGFYNASPTFSWQLPSRKSSVSQTAYQIVVASDAKKLPENADLWNSDKQLSNQSTWVSYQGIPFSSGQRVFWQVRYWNQNGEVSPWSEVNTIEMGLLKNSDWKGSWIGLDTAKDSIKGTRDVIIHTPQYLRKGFELNAKVVSAKLHVTAKGVFDVYLNGENIGDDVMSPGWTPYQKRIETLTYEVTDYLASGKNILAASLASGWYAGRLGWSKTRFGDADSPKLLAQLEIELSDGSTQQIVSDASWKATTNGPIRFAEIYDGETYDANYEMPNWTTTDFDDENWEKVITSSIQDDVQLQPKRHHSVKTKHKLSAKSILKRDNAVIFDLKQNMVGVPLLRVPMKKGDTLKIRFSEMLQPDGTFYTQNYRSAKSTDYYIAAKDGIISWSPTFTFHGFQFVELSGYDASYEPTTDWVTGLVQYSDFEQQGTFTSSHQKLNQLQSNIIWGLRGNFFDIPTDCPQRDERLGWTGDAQVFAPTSIFNADVHSFWSSWLQSLREEQFNNGGIPFVVPDVLRNNVASSGWGDAAVVVPWEIYYRTGDKQVLAENFDMMKQWVSYHESVSKNHISSMNSFGDWLQPNPIEKDNKRGDTAKSMIGTAYYAYVAKLTAKAAKVLGSEEDVATYESIAKTVSTAFEAHFFNGKGEIINSSPTQTGYLMAIGFDLLSPQMKEKAIPHLLEKIKEADTHLRTGFLGTPLLPIVLDQIGQTTLMRDILFKETYPSWFYSINQGATTMWERWNSYNKAEGFNPQRMNSLNHYAYGAIGQWMYERLAGIAPLSAGYKTIRIAPQPLQPLRAASAMLNTPFGKVVSSWETKAGEFTLTATVPPNTTATIVVPGNLESYNDTGVIEKVHADTNSTTLLVESGTYTFTSKK